MWNLLLFISKLFYIYNCYTEVQCASSVSVLVPLSIYVYEMIFVSDDIPIRMQSIQNIFYNIYFFRLDLQLVALTFF